MPPPAGLMAMLAGALAGSAFIAEPNDQESGAESAGVLHDQQTLDRTTVTHGHLLLWG